MTRPKEPHYFCKDFHQSSQVLHKTGSSLCYFECQSEEDYLSLYSKANKEQVCGESSTNYLYSKVAAKEIHRFNEDSKIIVVLREPVSFMYSLHAEYVNDTAEDVVDFESALNLEKQRVNGISVPQRTRCPEYLYYRERTKYADQLKRYLSLFQNENIKVVIFDDLKKDNANVFRDILTFVGVDPSFKVDFRRVHESKVAKNRYLNNLFRNPSLTYILKSRLPPRMYDAIQLRVQAILMKEKKRSSMNSALRKKLMKSLKSEVVGLNHLLYRKRLISTEAELVKRWSYLDI